ncbi:MAG: hypothetical protein ACK4WC_07840 [Rubrimonas sp.]
MNLKSLDILRRLAEIKAQAALADLASARRRAAQHAAAVEEAEEHLRATYAEDPGATVLWRLRAGLERRAVEARAARDRAEAQSEKLTMGARDAVARELGAGRLIDRARAAQALVDARRAERSAEVARLTAPRLDI